MQEHKTDPKLVETTFEDKDNDNGLEQETEKQGSIINSFSQTFVQSRAQQQLKLQIQEIRKLQKSAQEKCKELQQSLLEQKQIVKGLKQLLHLRQNNQNDRGIQQIHNTPDIKALHQLRIRMEEKVSQYRDQKQLLQKNIKQLCYQKNQSDIKIRSLTRANQKLESQINQLQKLQSEDKNKQILLRLTRQIQKERGLQKRLNIYFYFGDDKNFVDTEVKYFTELNDELLRIVLNESRTRNQSRFSTVIQKKIKQIDLIQQNIRQKIIEYWHNHAGK